jgi:hypothetical protein
VRAVAITGKFLILLFFAKSVIFKQRKKYILMGTYEIHKNFGVCNKSEGIRAPTTLKSEGEVTSLSGADKREVRDNREKSKYFSN